MVLVPLDSAPLYDLFINLVATSISATASTGWRVLVWTFGLPRPSSAEGSREAWEWVASQAFNAARLVTVTLVAAALFYVAVKAAYRFSRWIMRTGDMLLA